MTVQIFSNSATAMAAMPSLRPMKPMPSVVVALMLTDSTGTRKASAILCLMSRT